MRKVYMVRHQKAGIVTSHVFAEPPTPQQAAPIVAECERLHGRGGWVSVHEADLLTDGVPSFPERGGGSTDTQASVLPVAISGVGTVTAARKK